LKTEKKVFTKDDLEVSDIKIKSTITKADLKKLIPHQYSFTQIRAYQSCPRQYYYSHIVKLRGKGKAVFSFGKTMHSTLQKFFQDIINRRQKTQADLFGKNKVSSDPSLDDLMNYYKESWIDDWYNGQTEKEKYKKEGEKYFARLWRRYPKTNAFSWN